MTSGTAIPAPDTPDTEATVGTVAAFRLSLQQESAWSARASSSTGEAVTLRARLRDSQSGTRINAAAIQAALRQVVARHEILRTVYRRQPGAKLPFQVILNALEPHIERHSLADIEESAQSAAIAAWMDRERTRRFALEDGPVVVCLLFERGLGDHELLISLPAISGDPHSMANLVREIAQICAGEGPAPDADVLQYADFVAWQQELLTTEEMRPGRDYWSRFAEARSGERQASLEALESLSEAMPAADSAAAPAVIDRVAVEVAPLLLSGLEALCARTGIAISDLLLAGWSTLLSRYGGGEDLLLGAYFEGRKYEELHSALGYYGTYLPVHLAWEAESSLLAAARRAAAVVGEAARWQESYTPALAGAAGGGSEPPFLFSFFDLRSAGEFAGLDVAVVDLSVAGSACGFFLGCVWSDRGLRLELGCGGGYDRGIVERLLGHLVVLLESAVVDVEQRVGDLPLLGAGEQAELFVMWRGEVAELPAGSVGELICAQAGRTPERCAVRCGERSLSYAELAGAAHRLAGRLRGVGVAKGSLVGLLLERSVEMVVGVLGVLASGGAYVPLSAEQPAARLERQLAGVAVLVSERRLGERVPAGYGGLVVWVEELGEGSAATAEGMAELSTGDLAYVMYTSGSTGEPKGVEVTHGNLVNYCGSIARLLRLEEERSGLCFAMVSTLGADLGHTCLYPALLSGGTVDVVPYAVATDGEQMARYVAEHGVDVLKIVPSHLESLLATGGAGVLPRRYLITGGEGLRPALVEAVEQSGAGCRMINHYGPTETTVGSLVLELERGERWTGATVPIGRPLGNTAVYVLDPRGQVCPVGVAGELYIGGAGVTRGYRDRPELTAERFVADRFSGRAGARLYRTGDRVRSDAVGRIEYLGRLDDQVKIRGYRVEPGEVAGVLERQPEVRQAVVVAGEDDRGQVSLTGYVVARAGQAGAGRELGRELEARLRAELPEYMVPQAVVVLARLPLTANGKLDRAALPKPEAVAQPSYQPPQSPTEQLVAGIWAEVLKLPQVGLHDDFFLLGGHSLLATQVIARIRERSGAEIALRSLFEQPTLSRFATAVDGSPRRESPADGPIRRAPRNTYQPLRAEVPQ